MDAPLVQTAARAMAMQKNNGIAAKCHDFAELEVMRPLNGTCRGS
jgi:hypothetical protein